MKRVPLSTVTFDRKVKLTPQGRVYTIHSTYGFGKDIVLLDETGKEKNVSYFTDVYLLPPLKASN